MHPHSLIWFSSNSWKTHSYLCIRSCASTSLIIPQIDIDLSNCSNCWTLYILKVSRNPSRYPTGAVDRRRSANVFGVVLTCKQVNVESESGVNRCKSTWCRARENGSLNRRSNGKRWSPRSVSKSESKLSRLAMSTMDTPSPNVRFPLIACWVDHLTRW